MKYSVEIRPKAIKEIEILPSHIYRRICLIIDNLSVNPHQKNSLKLKGSLDRWRIRVSDYRILFQSDDIKKIIIISRVVHRKEAYR